METFYTLLAICAGNSPLTGELQLLQFGNESVISSHTLLSMWLFVHADIKVFPC